MAVPTTIADLSATEASNSPADTESITATTRPSDYLRAHATIIKVLANSVASDYQPLDATLTALAGALTAANKIPYATALNTLGELTLDTDGTLAANSDVTLATQKAVKTYVATHAFSAYSAIDQTVTAATFTKVTFGTEEFDVSGTFATSRHTPNQAGYYQYNFTVTGETNSANGQIVSTAYKNGARARDGTVTRSPVVSTLATSGSFVIYMNGTTDYMEIYAYIDGTNIKGTSAYQTHFSGFRIG